MSGRPVGRPRKTAPADAVTRIRDLTAQGASKESLAAAFGVGREVFVRWLAESPELAQAFSEGRAKVETKLVSKLMEKALAGDTVCLLFALKCLLGWREGEPIDRAERPAVTINIPPALSPDAYAKLIEVKK